MHYLSELGTALPNNWSIWLVTVGLIVAAVIDGFQLRVPNWRERFGRQVLLQL